MFEQFGMLPVSGGLYDQDPDFIAALRVERLARDDHQLFSVKQPDDTTKQRVAERKSALVKWRREQARRETEKRT